MIRVRLQPRFAYTGSLLSGQRRLSAAGYYACLQKLRAPGRSAPVRSLRTAHLPLLAQAPGVRYCIPGVGESSATLLLQQSDVSATSLPCGPLDLPPLAIVASPSRPRITPRGKPRELILILPGVSTWGEDGDMYSTRIQFPVLYCAVVLTWSSLQDSPPCGDGIVTSRLTG